MKHLLIIAACLLVFTFSCKKKDKEAPTCYWSINNEEFRSNQTFIEQGKAVTNFGIVRGVPNRVGFTFHLSEVPSSGSYYISNSGDQSPTTVGVGLYRDTIFYNVKYNMINKLTASVFNGRPRLQITDVWFRNYFDSEDSILVNCDFYVP